MTKRKKLKIARWIAIIYFGALAIMLMCPPIVEHFDRNDVWIGNLPESEFYLFTCCILVTIGIGVFYRFEHHIYCSGQNKIQSNVINNENKEEKLQ